jgi:hypothetical protein
MSTHTEDHLAEQPAIQLMEIELGWEVGGGGTSNVELLTSNFEVKRRGRSGCGRRSSG